MTLALVHTIVSQEGFRDPGHNARRMKLLDEMLAQLDQDDKLVVLPGGYVTATRESEIDQWREQLTRLAEGFQKVIVCGVDVIDPEMAWDTRAEDLVERGELPSFGVAVGLEEAIPTWRQASINNADAELVPLECLPDHQRVVTLENKKIAVLLCGELFNWRAREAIAETVPGLVLDLGHSGMGQGLIPAMNNLAELAHCPIAHAQHVAGWYGRSIHYVHPTQGQQSIPLDECSWVGDDNTWLAWTRRTL